jgi:serine/threonine-protein kinase
MTDVSLVADASGHRMILRSIKESNQTDRAIRRQFDSGAEILASLDHPNVARLLEFGEYEGRAYMLEHYYEGPNLRDRIGMKWMGLRHHQLPIIRQFASGLHHVHEQGFLHMDLKPENMLVTDAPHAVLLDFDLSLPHQGGELSLKTLLGSDTYFSPETLTRHVMSESAEIFTFGICMYEMLTAHKPFESVSREAYLRAVTDPRKGPLSVREYRSDIPAALESIILKCLAKDPGSRYPSMALVLRDLNALL